MNESKKNELASLLLSKDKELRNLAVSYIKSIYKGTFAVECLVDFDKYNHYKVCSIVVSSDSDVAIPNLLSWISTKPEFFTIQSILDLINLIIENNNEHRQNKGIATI